MLRLTTSCSLGGSVLNFANIVANGESDPIVALAVSAFAGLESSFVAVTESLD